MIEADLGRVLAVYYEALDATTESGTPDHAMRLRAGEALLDRGYGKATTRTELSSPEDGAVTIATLAAAALRVLPPGIEIEGCEPITTTSTG